VQGMEPRWPKTAEMVARAEEDVLIHVALPYEHWPRIHSINMTAQGLLAETHRRACEAFPLSS